MTFKVVQVMDQPGSALPDYGLMIAAEGIDVEFSKTDCQSEDAIISAAAGADVIITAATRQPITRRVIQELPQIRFIMSMGIGYDHIDIETASEHGVLVANVPDYCLEEMSDHVMALILALTRKVIKLDSMVKAGGWKQEPEPEMQQKVWPTMSRLRGQTLGLIGLGRVPRTLLPKAKGFGMQIVAYDPYLASEMFASLGVEKVELDDLLAQSDVVSLHAALTDQTRHMLGADQFNQMKASAYLVNTARGPLVDHEALCDALTANKLAGAALDVTEPEPINPGSPLLKMENVIITAHAAHASIPAFIDLLQRPGQEVARVLQGDWPVGLVNPGARDKYLQRFRQG